MPVQRKYDFQVNGQGYMLSRAGPMRGRSWQRSGVADAPSRVQQRWLLGAAAVGDFRFGMLPDTLDHPEVWTDWSGGFGDAYRTPTSVNTVHWSENMDTRFPHQMVHCQQMQLLDSTSHGTISSSIVGIMDVPAPTVNLQFAGCGGIYVLKAGAPTGLIVKVVPTDKSGAGTRFDEGNSYDFNVGPGRPAVFGSYAYVPNEASYNHYAVITLDESNLISQPSNQEGYGFAGVGNKLWKFYGAQGGGRRIYVDSLAAGANQNQQGNWSATLSIGNGANQINDIIGLGDQVYLGLEDGLYQGDSSGTFINVLGDLSGQAHADNCRDLTTYNGAVVAQHIAGIFAYQPSTGRSMEIGPAFDSNTSPVIGRFRTTRSYAGWLYAGLWTGSQGYLLAGREDTSGFTWHVMNRFPHTARPQRMHVDGITASSGNQSQIPNRMWMATDPSINTGGTAPLYYWPIPLGNANPLTPQVAFSANYVGSARVDLPATDWQAPGTPKVFRAVEVWADNFASGAIWANLYYTIDNGTRTLLGTINTSPKTTLYFPSTSGAFLTGQSIVLSLESFTATAAMTPIYRAIVLRGALRPLSVDVITANVDVSDQGRDRQGAAMRPGANQLAELRALATQQQAVQLVDLAGATSIVEVLAPVEEQEVYQAGDDNPYLVATVKMAVLTFTGS